MITGSHEPERAGGVRWLKEGLGSVKRTAWEGRPKRVTAPYLKMQSTFEWLLCTAGHVEPCGNLPGPSGKANYSFVTDSEPVP